MDRIEIRGLRVFGRHGVFAHEQRDGQTFVLDVTLEANLAAAARSDDLADTIDYGTLAQRLATAVAQTRFDLIEALAGHLAELVLAEGAVQAVEVRVGKPEAPVELDFDEVAVVLRRERS
jgi:dihydroneopterin aldolase